MRRSVASILGALLLMFSAASATLAAKPAVETFVEEDTFQIDCGTFALTETYRQTIRVTSRFDDNGDVASAGIHASFYGVITGNGSTLRLADPAHWNVKQTFSTEGVTEQQTGLVYRFRIPGVGLIAHDAGNITFHADGSVTVKGPHDVFDEGLENLICPLFE
jgi:hypothetical protein